MDARNPGRKLTRADQTMDLAAEYSRYEVLEVRGGGNYCCSALRRSGHGCLLFLLLLLLLSLLL